MCEIDRLITKHRTNGILVDTNLLVLFLVGSVERRLVLTHKRLSAYTVKDFDLLIRLLAQFVRIFTTPHILTETSNLAKLKGSDQPRLQVVFKKYVRLTEEIHEASQTVITHPSFDKFGLTDAAIARSANQPLLVLTEDLDLWAMLTRRGIDAINFNHLRP